MNQFDIYRFLIFFSTYVVIIIFVVLSTSFRNQEHLRVSIVRGSHTQVLISSFIVLILEIYNISAVRRD
jgi:hypothetical protein